jgi:hypothetical protein
MARTKRKSSRVADTAPVASAEKRNQNGNVEEQICDLLRATDLSATLLEGPLSGGRRENCSSVYLPEQFQERLIFAAYKVEKRRRVLTSSLRRGVQRFRRQQALSTVQENVQDQRQQLD